VNPADVHLVEQIRQATRGASQMLRALAKRGKVLEQDEPQRAAFLVSAVRTHPLYKGGRLTFDMLEIEDLILDGWDGSPLDSMNLRQVTEVLSANVNPLVETLLRMAWRTEVDRTPVESRTPGAAAPAGHVSAGAHGADELSTPAMPHVILGPADAPPALADASTAENERREERQREVELQASDYLYDYVVLGFLDVLGGIRRPRPAAN
jgi:hypothetical protein